VASVIALAITLAAGSYYAFLLMGYLEVWHRRLWQELGSPVPTTIAPDSKFRLVNWVLRGRYRDLEDRRLAVLARRLRFFTVAFFAYLLIVIVGSALLPAN
jgi:hypothetical protein